MSNAQIRKLHAWWACLVLLLVLTAFSAMATEDRYSIAFELSLEPTSMTAPGDVNLSIRVTNAGDEDISEPLSLFDADGKPLAAAFDGGSLLLLKAGESRTWQGKWAVSQQHLDSGKLVFTLQYNKILSDGTVSPVHISSSANIQFTGERVDLQVIRRIDPQIIRPGATVTIHYDFVNNGNVKLTDIKIREHRSIATDSKSVGTLLPGESASLQISKTNARAELESASTITYYKEGDKKQLRQTVESQSIPLAKPKFSSDLVADKTSVSIGETVVLTLTLANEGNITYSNVRVTDAKLGEVFTNIEIPAGQTIVRTKEVTMTEPAAFRFTLDMEDNTGTKKTEKTNELKVSAYDENQMLRLNLQLSADRASVATIPGFIRFTVLVTNDSNAPAKNVKILHGDTLVYTFASIDPGQSIPVTRDFEISQAGKFRFTAETVDPLDNLVSFSSNELSIPHVPATPKPTQGAAPTVPPVVTLSPVPRDFANPDAARWRNVLFILTLAFGVFFAAGFILFAVSSVMRLRARRQSSAAYDHLQLEPKRDFNDPTTYDARESPLLPDDRPPELSGQDARPRDAFPEEELPHHKYLRKDTDTLSATDFISPGAEKANTATSPPAGRPLTPDEDTGYSLTRDAEPESDIDEKEMRQRNRRADKHGSA